jgi:putative polyketide hydroxylase
MSSDLAVAIIGGGPCGLMTALLLARAGVRCAVYEKKSGISTHPKAMGVSRRTAELYRQLGLIAAIENGSLGREDRFLSIWAKSLIGEELGRTPFAEVYSDFTPCTALHCPQTWTEKVLLDAVSGESLVTVNFDSEVRGIEPGGDQVKLTFSKKPVLEVPWVVAADGAGSMVRHRLEVETDGPGDMGHFLNVMFRANYGPHLRNRLAILYPVVSSDYLEFFVTVDGNDLWLMHHFLEPGETGVPADQLQSIIRHASGLPEEPVEILSVMPWVMSPKVARQYRSGRVFLTGDAAARLSPSGGLGLNTGLQSVHNLAWKLAAVINHEAGEALLDSYQDERRQAAYWTMGNTNRNAGEIFEIAENAMKNDWDRVRELVAHSRRTGSGLGQDLGISYSQGAFLPDGSDAPVSSDSVNDYQPIARPGSRAPHLWIEQQGKTVSILDLFGRTFVLLVGRECEAAKLDVGSVLVLQNRRDFTAGSFEDLYGISAKGGVLVRPDGYVGARWKVFTDGIDETVRSALRVILGGTEENRPRRDPPSQATARRATNGGE